MSKDLYTNFVDTKFELHQIIFRNSLISRQFGYSLMCIQWMSSSVWQFFALNLAFSVMLCQSRILFMITKTPNNDCVIHINLNALIPKLCVISAYAENLSVSHIYPGMLAF